MKETSLNEILKQYLGALRYVIIFDDLWVIEFWEHVKYAFPKNNKGSKIVITTKSEEVAPSNKESPYYNVYKLPPLSLEKSSELFYKMVFQCDGGKCPPNFIELSCAIVERCGGLLLAILAIGGL